MSTILSHRMQDVRRRVRRTLAIDGVSRVVSVLVGCLCFFGLVDYFLHVNDAGIRCVLLVGIVGGTAFVAWNYLVQPLRTPVSDVEIATVVERRNPHLSDRLSTTVSFLQHEIDARAGSPELQRHVIGQTLDEAESLRFDVIDSRTARRMLALALAICVGVGALFAFRSTDATIAARRLVFPFARIPWPRQTLLLFVSETGDTLFTQPGQSLRVAYGSRVELFVENARGLLPDDAHLLIQFPRRTDLARRELKSTMLTGASGQSLEVGTSVLAASAGPIAFRAVGGDDDGTAWHHIDVIPPPAIRTLTVTVNPPGYTGRAATTLPAGLGHVEAIVGTNIDFKAVSSKPLSAASLHVGGAEPEALEIAADGKTVSSQFTPGDAGVYSWWIALTDQEGFTNENDARFELRAIADRVPDVFIEKPDSDLQVTAVADVPIRVVAKDDIGLDSVQLKYRTGLSEDAAEVSISLGEFVETVNEQTLDHVWSLRDLRPAHGTRILFHAEAVDRFDGEDPHAGRSVPRALIVVAPEEKAAEIALRQSELLEELERVTDLQEKVRNQTGELELQLETAGELRTQDVDLLKRVELEQRRVATRLTAADDGLEASTKELLNEFDANRLEHSEMRDRLENLSRQLEVVGREFLPVIENELTRARKSAENENTPAGTEISVEPNGSSNSNSDNSVPTEASAADSLSEAHSNQQAVLETLSGAIHTLNEWKQRQDVVGDLESVIDIQEQLRGETAQLGNGTLGKSTADLTAQQQADIAKLAQRQERTADELNSAAESLRELSKRLSNSGTTLEDALRAADEELAELATASRMQQAAEQIGANRIGEAGDNQQAILQELEQIRDLLENRPADRIDSLARKLEQTEDQLRRLRQKQSDLLSKLEEAEQLRKTQPDAAAEQLRSLKQQQEELRNQLRHEEQQLRRLWMRRPADAASRASDAMTDLSQQLQSDSQPADELQKAGEEILDELDQAIRETQREIEQLQQQLAREAIVRMVDSLGSLVTRQQGVIDETERLDQLAAEQQGRLRRSQLRTLVDLEETQRLLSDETLELAETVASARVVRIAVQGAAGFMHKAAELLSQRETGAPTIAAETSAVTRLIALVEILKQPEPETTDSDAGDGEQAEPNANQPAAPPGEVIPAVVQLQLVRTMQQDLLDRTRQLEESGVPDLEAESRQLAEEQGQLADLAEELFEEYLDSFNDSKTSGVEEDAL